MGLERIYEVTRATSHSWLFEKLEEEDDDSLLEPSPYLWCLDWELLVVDMVKSKERLSEVKEEESKDWGKLDGSATVKKGYLNW